MSAVHVCLLALVVMVMLFRPVLDIATEVHLADHGVTAAHGATPATDQSQACDKDSDLERAHGLAHQESSGSVCADLSAEMLVPLVRFPPRFDAPPAVVRIPTRYLATPFKPPIA